jgi:hypothetical protein
MAPGCVNTYASFYTTPRMQVIGSPPVSVDATQNQHYGWTETVCVSCNNDFAWQTLQTKTYDNWKVT